MSATRTLCGIALTVFMMAAACKRPVGEVALPAPIMTTYTLDSLQLTEEAYYNKVLGALVGSALGDAMGAATEMWSREDIRLIYGYVTGPTGVIRPQSPEGPWANNLPKGATTDDTRWKLLMGRYLLDGKAPMGPTSFSRFITDQYQAMARSLHNDSVLTDTGAWDKRVKKVEWIKEWARVAMAHEQGTESYQKALNRFYGGEMSCAGQLYSPMFGLIAEQPATAYSMAYEHAIFDIGYAKDISGLVATMTHMALRNTSVDSILHTLAFIDPIGYGDSRLVGRIPFAIMDASIKSTLAIQETVVIDSSLARDSVLFKVPDTYTGTQDQWARQELVYRYLEKDQRSIAFHAGEIWQILVTALQFGKGDFAHTLQFIVNYGRDNDTVAAIAGMVLGAKVGYNALPDSWKNDLLLVNKELLGIDLQELARDLTAAKYGNTRSTVP